MEGASIAEEIGNGSRQAEDQLVARYDGTLMTQVRRMTRDVHDAEDICQEVMHVVIEKLRRRQLRNPNALDEFVRQVGKYQTVEFYRRRKWLEYRGECDPVDPTPDCHGHTSLREERQSANWSGTSFTTWVMNETDRSFICSTSRSSTRTTSASV
jgi:DNA-directed RNA polymerase specialized sigma24 family protein